MSDPTVTPPELDPGLLDWLLDSDPALRWQVERDLAGAAPEVWQTTRARVSTEGVGARLLALQDDDGQWAGGAYFPGGPHRAPVTNPGQAEHTPPTEDEGQPWTATTWSLNSLREWGTDAAALAGTVEKIAANSRWEYDDLPYWGGEVDCCINAFTLANGVWLGADVAGIAQWFLDHQMAEGGWNCEWENGSTRSSFHSTTNTVRGLLAYEQATGGHDELRAARHAGEEYLLQRHALRTRTSGELVGPWVSRLAYPFRWRHTALAAVDHFRAASLYEGVAPDPRLAEAVELVRAARRPDGTFVQQPREVGIVWFDVDVPAGEPSKWLTFSCTRALAWWDSADLAS